MSVALATPYQVGGGGFPLESDPSAAVVSVTISMSGSNPVVTVNFAFGVATVAAGKTTGFAAGATAPSLSIAFTLGNINNWQSSNGLSGALSAGEISAVTSVLNGILAATRNPAEAFAIGHNIFGPGGAAVVW
jgi:hypothetical protein